MKRILITTLVGLTGLLVRSENRIVAGNDASSTGTLLSLGAGETLDYGLFSFGDDAAASAEAKSYVRFDMAGGLLRLGAEGWRVGSKWNACADPNSIYSVRLAGGTVKAADDTAIALETEIPSGGSVVFDTDGHAMGALGPIVGDGSLTKRGAGTLLVQDASEFKGSLSVEQGVVELVGANGGTAVAESYVAWTGDGAAVGKADGDTVTAWVSTDGKVTASNPVTGGTIGYAAPTVVANAFNGHAALMFDKCGLEIAAGDNPLAGQASWTVAVVFKTSTTSGSGDSAGTSWQQGMNLLGNADGSNGFGLAYVKPGSYNYLAFGGSFGSQSAATRRVGSEPGRNLADGKTHVALCSHDGRTLAMNLDGFVTNVVSSAAEGTYPCFSDKPLYFGFSKLNRNIAVESRFNGQIAEIRFYPNRALTANELRVLGLELGVKYGLAISDQMAFAASGAGAVPGELSPVTPTAVAWPTGADVFDADALNATVEDGAAVDRWQSTGVSVATVGGAGSATYGNVGPTLVKNAVNGKSVLRFDATAKTALGCPSSGLYAHLLAGKDDVSVAVVFRTTADGTGTAASYATGAGLVSTYQSEANKDEFELGFIEGGSVKAGIGTANGTAGNVARLTDAKPALLNDGKPHVAVLTVSKTDGKMALMVDGRYSENTTTIANARATANVAFGIFKGNPGKTTDRQHFTGDIAMVRLYDRALTRNEMTALTQAACQTYGMRPAAKTGASWGSAGCGLGATNVAVAAGATLRLPMAAQHPYTVGVGQAFDCRGTVEGTLVLADGACLKVGAAPFAVASVRASGAIVLDVTGAGNNRDVLTYGEADLSGVTAWIVLRDGLPVKAQVMDDVTHGRLRIKYARGLVLVFR